MASIQPCIEKIFINLNAPPAFNLRHKILGDQNANLQYIVNETKANVSLRGRGSGFIEPNLGVESSEPLHLYIEHSTLKNLIEAKNLARNLLETVQSDLQIFMQTNSVSQAIPIQQPPPIFTSNNQITIPSAVLSVPPPNIIQNNTIQPTHIIQQSNFIPQAQIIPQQMQIIQQTPINIPPPVPIRTAAPISVQFQAPPANIQIQPTTGQQILFNQAAPQYQLQYIPATNQIGATPQAQTIQHFIQPQQQIQGILQSNGQQFITVQGNTAFMIPPPNIVQPQTVLQPQFNTINPAEVVDATKTDLSKVVKQEDQKNQTAARAIVANINQPPPPIHQFIVNANPWPQQQQMPLNSQIQIVSQPQAFRNGNEIVIQNTLPTASSQGQQQVISFNPQQQGPSLQQIQFTNQPIITQPPPPIQIQQTQPQTLEQSQQPRTIPQMPPSTMTLSYQQQFEQKINMGESQQRAMKRKIDDTEAETKDTSAFLKTGMGAMSKTRPPPVGQPQMSKMGARSAPQKSDSMSVNSKTGGNKSMYSKSGTAASTMTSTSMKVNVSQAETSKPPPQSSIKSENEFVEVQNFDIANQTFMVRPANQFYRFNGPQNFIRQQQPPPNMQQQFSRPQMMIPPPSTGMPIQQDLNAANFQNINRFNAPRGGMMMMPGNSNNEILINVNYQQQQQQQNQPRFRQQW